MKKYERKTLREAVEEYVTYRRGAKSRSTAIGDAQVLRRFVDEVGDRQLQHLEARDVRDWFYGPNGLMAEHTTRDGRVRQPLQPSTHNFYAIRLRAFIDFCREENWLGTTNGNLMRYIVPRRVPKKRRQQPPPDVLLRMLDVARDARDRAYLALTINTALRASEARRITVGDVDLVGGWLSVQISKALEEDLLPITADLDHELRRWLIDYEQAIGRPLRPGDYLFPARTHGRYPIWVQPPEVLGRPVYRVSTDGRCLVKPEGTWSPERAATKTEEIIKTALASLGLPTKYEGTHTVRRAIARAFFDSMADDTGYDAALRTVSALLHHASVVTTEKYLGLTSERKRRDEKMRGQPFLTAMVDRSNVTPLRVERRA